MAVANWPAVESFGLEDLAPAHTTRPALGSFGLEDIETPTVPEMDVSRGTSIADGGNDTITGTVVFVPMLLNYLIENNGANNLAIGTTTISGQTQCTATVSISPSSPVIPTGSTTLQVTLTPTSPGAFSFNVSIVNDDGDENPYNWTASGVANSAGSASGVIANSAKSIRGMPGIGVR